jgi:hypothetical protein
VLHARMSEEFSLLSQVDGARHFELAGTLMVQHNLCFWGSKLGMHDDATPFSDSSTLQLHNASFGNVHGNTLVWKCSGYDMDVSRCVSHLICMHASVRPITVH